MKRRNFILYSLSTLFVTILGFSLSSDCAGYPSEEKKAIKAAMKSVEKERDRMGTESLWKSGPLNGGIGVLSIRDWAYWYKDGVVYAANGLAMSASPKLEKSPGGIDYFKIKAIAK